MNLPLYQIFSVVCDMSSFVARMRTPEPGTRISLAVQADGAVPELIGDIGQQQPSFLLERNAAREKAASYHDCLSAYEPQLFQADPAPLSYRPTISLLVQF